MDSSRTRQAPAAAWAARGQPLLARVVAVLVFAQALFAGQFMSGSSGWLKWHRANGYLIALVVLVQLALAAFAWLRGQGQAWPALVALALLVAVVAQIVMGNQGRVAVHVPLGVAIFGFAVALAAGAGRPARRRGGLARSEQP